MFGVGLALASLVWGIDGYIIYGGICGRRFHHIQRVNTHTGPPSTAGRKPNTWSRAILSGCPQGDNCWRSTRCSASRQHPPRSSASRWKAFTTTLWEASGSRCTIPALSRGVEEAKGLITNFLQIRLPEEIIRHSKGGDDGKVFKYETCEHARTGHNNSVLRYDGEDLMEHLVHRMPIKLQVMISQHRTCMAKKFQEAFAQRFLRRSYE